MPSSSRLLLLVLVCACARPTSRTTARVTAESEVRLAQRQRFEAMINHDAFALDTLLDDDLSYVHIGKSRQSRKQFIDNIGKGSVVYESIAPSRVRVRVYDGLALAMGRSDIRTRTATGGVASFGVRFTEVYVRREGRWVLAAWEARRLPS